MSGKTSPKIAENRPVGRHIDMLLSSVSTSQRNFSRPSRTLLYEAANVMLTRCRGQLKIKDWAFAIARRSTMRKARVAPALAIIMHAMLRDGTEFEAA
jgi:hypothetical protein